MAKASSKQIRPWLRFWARMMDYLLMFVALMVLLSIIFDWHPQRSTWITILVPLIWMFLEPLFLKKWGMTPGKAFLRMSVTKKNGSKLSYEEGFERSLKVWIRGVGLGIPLVNVIMCIVSYIKLKKNRITGWDRDCETVVHHEKVGIERTVLFVCLFIVGLFISWGLGLVKQ
jgi:uncharacterized RDD family membrane protein YckC